MNNSFLSRPASVTAAFLATAVCITRHYDSPITVASEFVSLFACYAIALEYLVFPVARAVSGVTLGGASVLLSFLNRSLGLLLWLVLSPLILIRWLSIKSSSHQRA